jgi:tetratricopeptide (TPR) repeat protein
MKNSAWEKERFKFLYTAGKLLEKDNLLEAYNLARERLLFAPADADAHVVAVDALIGMGRYDEARDLLGEIGDHILELSLVYDRLGDIYRKNGFYREAHDCYEKFVSLGSEPTKAREVMQKMSLLARRDGTKDEAGVAAGEKTFEPELLTVTLADLYMRQGHFSEAEKILLDIIKKEPQNMQAVEKLDLLRASLPDKFSADMDPARIDNLIDTLSSWLKNIERLKANATEK